MQRLLFDDNRFAVQAGFRLRRYSIDFISSFSWWRFSGEVFMWLARAFFEQRYRDTVRKHDFSRLIGH